MQAITIITITFRITLIMYCKQSYGQTSISSISNWLWLILMMSVCGRRSVGYLKIAFKIPASEYHPFLYVGERLEYSPYDNPRLSGDYSPTCLHKFRWHSVSFQISMDFAVVLPLFDLRRGSCAIVFFDLIPSNCSLALLPTLSSALLRCRAGDSHR